MSQDYEYCILGGGAIGSAAAYLLARSAASVILLEQYEFGHEQGSSHGESRITRYSYDHPHYVRMAKRAYPLWAELMSESEEAIFLKTGGLDLDEDGGKRIEACISSLQTENIPFETLDAAEISKRFPQFRIPSHAKGLFQEDTGILNAALCVRALQGLAARHGAAMQDTSPVNRFEFQGKSVVLSTPTGEIKAGKLLLCAGAWMGPLLSGWGLNLPLIATQEQYAFFKPFKPEDFAPERFPIFIHYGGGTGSGGIGWYGFPVYGKDGVKSSIHHTGAPVVAGQRDGIPDQRKLSDLQALMQKLLPDAAGEIIHSTTCLYTNTPDTHFVIDRLQGRENAVFFAGCSGHAFKFALVIAEALIALANQEAPCIPMDLFSSSRFSGRK